MSSQDTTTMYAPLVEYTQNKQFAGLMETLFGAIEKLQEQNKINEGDYLDLANLTKKLYEAKTQIQQSVVYVEIIRRAEKKPPQPPKAVDKLNDPNYRTCEFCSKRLHCKFLREHQRTSRSCVEKQQGKRNVKVEGYTTKDDRHTRRQAFAVQLIPRYKTEILNGNRMETVIKIRGDSQGFEKEYYENGENYIHNDRIMGVQTATTPPPYAEIDKKTNKPKGNYPHRENHSDANKRDWYDRRPDVAPTYEPYHQWVEADCDCCKEDFCGICMNPTKQKIGGSAVKTQEQISKEIREVNEKKSNKELYEICMSRGIVVNKSYRKEEFIKAIIANAFNKKTVEVDSVYAEVVENDVCYTYDKAPKKKKNKKATLIIEEDE